MTAALAGAAVRRPAVWRELVVSGAFGRSLRWQPVAIFAIAAATSGLAMNDDLAALRATAVVLALGVGFVVDDASFAISAAVPVSRPYRLVMRMGAGVVAAAVTLSIVGVAERSVGASVLAGVALEAATLLAAALGAGVVAHYRFGVAEASFAGAAAVGAIIVTAYALPPRWALTVGAGPDWAAAHVRWAVLLAPFVVVLVSAAREPATVNGRRNRRDHAKKDARATVRA